MGKKGTWFSAVRKAFRSPSKDKDHKDKEKGGTKSVPKIASNPSGDLPQVEVPVRILLPAINPTRKGTVLFTKI
jgi:hypothetical protein